MEASASKMGPGGMPGRSVSSQIGNRAVGLIQV